MDMGGIDDVEAIGNEAPLPGLGHHPIEEPLETLGFPAALGSDRGSCDSGVVSWHSTPKTTCKSC
jgi:hypothetical protein